MGSTVTDPLVGRLVDGRYEVVSRLARGGMATVYLATDRRLDREVALKVMHPHLAETSEGIDFVARFRREAQTVAKLTHAGLVAVYDQGVDGETSYLAMEYVDGVNLRRQLSTQGCLTLGEALSVTEKVLDALSAAHRAGLVHRDIKPENVLLATDGRVKLADFGLARAVTEVTATTTGTVLGTVAYLAPELVARGESDARTDVYAVGVLLYEMITGRQPFVGATPVHVAFQHVNNDVPAPSRLVPWLPVEVDDLVGALTARDPAERLGDALAAHSLLRRVRAELDPQVLTRRATLPPGEEPSSPSGPTALDATHHARHVEPVPDRDEQDTARIGHSGATVALPIGLGLPARVAPAPPPTPRPARHRGRRLLVVLGVLIGLGALGFGGWWFVAGPGSPTVVPPVVGVTRAQAQSALTQAHLLGTFSDEFDSTAPVGQVLSTTPAPGTRLSWHATVRVVISKGPDWVNVPTDLVGRAKDAVVAALTAAGLDADPSGQAYDDHAAVGSVLSAKLPDGTDASAHTQLVRGTTVILTLSTGPAPVTMPPITGMSAADATALLAADALRLTTSQDWSDTVPAGQIVSQSRSAGDTVHRGDEITAVVSKGPQLVAVPNVVDKSSEQAQQLIQDAGLVFKAQDYLGGFFDRVRFQDVPAGKQVPKGTTVTVTVW